MDEQASPEQRFDVDDVGSGPGWVPVVLITVASILLSAVLALVILAYINGGDLQFVARPGSGVPAGATRAVTAEVAVAPPGGTGAVPTPPAAPMPAEGTAAAQETEVGIDAFGRLESTPGSTPESTEESIFAMSDMNMGMGMSGMGMEGMTPMPGMDMSGMGMAGMTPMAGMGTADMGMAGMTPMPESEGTDSELALELRNARARIAELEAEVAQLNELMKALGGSTAAIRRTLTPAALTPGGRTRATGTPTPGHTPAPLATRAATTASSSSGGAYPTPTLRIMR